MAQDRITIAELNAGLADFQGHYTTMSQYFSKIDANYLNSIQQKWNSKTAHKYFTSLCSALNATIRDMNNGFSKAVNCLEEAGKHIATAEGGTSVKHVTLPNIKEISIGWQGKEDGYNISDEVSQFTKENFSSVMTKIISEADNCKTTMNNKIKEGLSAYVASDAIAAISKMIDSAQNVNKEYDDKAVKNAATEDANVKGYKIQTS